MMMMILILKNLIASLSMKLLTMLYVIKITIILRHKCTMSYKHDMLQLTDKNSIEQLTGYHKEANIKLLPS